MDNESGTQIRSIAVEYPGKTEIVATKIGTVSLSLGISELASGETMTWDG